VGAARDPVIVAVGDIACAPGSPQTSTSCQQRQTAALAAAQHPNAVLVLGDNQYESGSLSEYEGSYNPSWGVFNPIVHPVPGNHEYNTPGAAGYFDYFGATTNFSSGTQSFNLGTWHIVGLNSNCSDSACQDSFQGATTTAQVGWLQANLSVNRTACLLAYWHHPRFAQGFVGDSPGVGPLWNALYNDRGDLVLNGHDHMFERYAQQDPSGSRTTSGLRQIVAGTGGYSLFGVTYNKPNGEPPVGFTDYSDFGILVLTLHPTSYSWAFKRIPDGAVIDTGTTACHLPG
jgi:hypothetical protein